jgi:hypothetical protein
MKNPRNLKKIVIAFTILIILTNMVLYDKKTIRKQSNSEINTPILPIASEWANNEIPICTAINEQVGPKICSDGGGGGIMVWIDKRKGEFEYDIYAQRVNSTGDVQWNINGIRIGNNIMSGSDELIDDDLFQICSDGAGGAIIAFADGFMTSSNIYAQRIDENGAKLWGFGLPIPICTAGNIQDEPQLCSDGAEGAIITWYDYRGGGSIYAQRVNATGSIMWTANGVPVSPTSNLEFNQQICSDGAGGAIITWQDYRGVDTDVYAQRIDSNGVVQWTTDGVPLCTASQNQEQPQICSDGAGGAIITWIKRGGPSFDIYAQKVNAAGDIQWTFNGKALCSGLFSYEHTML